MPLTAEDVRFTFEYYRTYTRARFTARTRNLEPVEAPNPSTVVFRLKSPDAGFRLQTLADVPILPKHIWETVTAPLRFMNTVGRGPVRAEEGGAGPLHRPRSAPRPRPPA